MCRAKALTDGTTRRLELVDRGVHWPGRSLWRWRASRGIAVHRHEGLCRTELCRNSASLNCILSQNPQAAKTTRHQLRGRASANARSVENRLKLAHRLRRHSTTPTPTSSRGSSRRCRWLGVVPADQHASSTVQPGMYQCDHQHLRNGRQTAQSDGSQFTAHCGRGACRLEGRDHRQEEWRDHLALG